MDQTPWAWLQKNVDGLALAIGATIGAALVSAFLRGLSATSVLLSLVAAFTLTATAVPLAAIYWALPWPWWPVIGVGLGVGSLSVMWTLLGIADRVRQRAPDIADRAIDRVTGPGGVGPGAKSEGQP